MKKLKIFSLFILALLTGCATIVSMTTVVRLAYDGDPRPLSEVAVVMGDGRITFLAIDGLSPSHYRKLAGNAIAGIAGGLQVDVLPGTHEFELCYAYKETVGINARGQPIYQNYQCNSSIQLTQVAEAGKIYQITYKDSGRRLWTAEIADVTEKYRERMQASREKLRALARARGAKVE